MINLRTVLLAGVAMAIAVCAGCGSGQSIDPKADQALRSMSDTLGQAETLSFLATGTMDEMIETGQLAQFTRKSEILLARPDKLAVKTAGDDLSRSAWYDGKRLTILDRTENTYASIEVPDDVEEMFDFVIEEYGLTIPVADLLFRSPHKTLVANVTTGLYIGQSSVQDHLCHHLAFRQEAIDWQIWIDAGEVPVPRKLLITYKQEPGQPSYSVTMSDWNLSAKAGADRFTPILPKDAKLVEMDDLLGREAGP